MASGASSEATWLGDGLVVEMRYFAELADAISLPASCSSENLALLGADLVVVRERSNRLPAPVLRRPSVRHLKTQSMGPCRRLAGSILESFVDQLDEEIEIPTLDHLEDIWMTFHAGNISHRFSGPKPVQRAWAGEVLI